MPEDNAVNKTNSNSGPSVYAKTAKLPKKKSLLIPVLICVLLLLILVNSLLSRKTPESRKTVQTIDETASLPISPLAESTLSLAPNPIVVNNTSKGVIDVILDTKSNAVTAVQLELQYDPTVLTNVLISSSAFFANPVELMKKIDTKNGRITYMLGISPSQQPLTGTGTVAQITFTKNKGTKSSETEFSFYRTNTTESIVAATGIDLSVLKDTHDTKIILQK